jgi:NhaP-type Na+/H+ or K+/H+ antiporter
MEYFQLLALLGLAAFGMAWMPAISKISGVAYSVIYLLLGVVIYILFPNILPASSVHNNEEITVRATEIVVIVSLMGTGIRIDRSFTLRNWSSPLRLIGIAMLACITLGALLSYNLLDISLASALLLASALSPTDPVLASDVQVGPPNEKIRSDTKFSLTAEAGLNDGMAFPFVWLAIILVGLNQADINSQTLVSWFGYHLVYKLVAGAAIGFIFGRAAGYLVFTLSEIILC